MLVRSSGTATTVRGNTRYMRQCVSSNSAAWVRWRTALSQESAVTTATSDLLERKRRGVEGVDGLALRGLPRGPGNDSKLLSARFGEREEAEDWERETEAACGIRAHAHRSQSGVADRGQPLEARQLWRHHGDQGRVLWNQAEALWRMASWARSVGQLRLRFFGVVIRRRRQRSRRNRQRVNEVLNHGATVLGEAPFGVSFVAKHSMAGSGSEEY